MNSERLAELRIDANARKRPRRAFWLILFLVAAIVVVSLFFGWPRKQDSQRLAGVTNQNVVATGKVSHAVAPAVSPTNSVLTVSGYIVNRERIEISPRFIGVVKWIGVKKGDAVTNGQVVVLLDDTEQKARLSEVAGRLTNATIAVAKAELDYERIIQLAKTAIETKQAEDDARLKLESARATVREVEGSYAVAKTYLDWTVIRSPIDGVVLEKLVDPAELVVPQSFGGGRGPSTALIAVADPKDLQVEIDLNEADVGKVFLNQTCRVSPEAYPDKSYEGYVAEMAPEANRQKGTLQVKVQIREPNRFLTPELSAKVDFLGREQSTR